MELSLSLRRAAIGIAATVMTLAFALPTYAQSHQGGEANLVLPDLCGEPLGVPTAQQGSEENAR